MKNIILNTILCITLCLILLYSCSSTSNSDYAVGYGTGYEEGYEEGYNDCEENYEDDYSFGYEEGYREGLREMEHYFDELLSLQIGIAELMYDHEYAVVEKLHEYRPEEVENALEHEFGTKEISEVKEYLEKKAITEIEILPT